MSMRGMGFRTPKMNIKKPKVNKPNLNTQDMTKTPNIAKNVITKVAGPKTRNAKPIGSKDSI